MRSGKALPARQPVRPVGEEGDIGAFAAIGHEVPRAIHVGRLLEQPHGNGAHDQRRDNECRWASQRVQTTGNDAGCQCDERSQGNHAHQPLAGGVNEVQRPPASGADPAPR